MLKDQIACVDIGPLSWLQPKMERLWQAGFPCEVLEPTPGFVGLYINASDEDLYRRLRPLDQ